MAIRFPGYRALHNLIVVFLLPLSWGVSAKQPNVLLIIADDLNMRIGPYMGIKNHTPALDRSGSARSKI